MSKVNRYRWAALSLALASGAALAQTSVAPPVRLRGTIEAVDLPRITLKERSGQSVIVSLADKLNLQEALAIDPGALQAGAFIGTAAVPRGEGRLESLEVVVQPESSRGVGEGHFAWDLQPSSSMTNATVADLVRSAGGRELTLRYVGGEKKVFVPDGVPVVTLKAGDRALIRVGAKVFAVATASEGGLTATRLVIGRDGFEPPM